MSAKYEFTVKTGDEAGAGTDSNIFVILHGERGRTDEVRLNGYIKGNAFERNQTDTFMAPFGEDVGDIYKITLRSDKRYSGSAWLLDRIDVRFVLNSAQHQFRSPSIFRIATWIKDTATHTLNVTEGYRKDIQVKEDWVVVDGAPQIILDNPSPTQVQEQTIAVRTSGKTSLVYEHESVVSISAKATVSKKFAAFKATLEAEFKTAVTEKAQISLENDLSFEHDYVIRTGPGEKGRQLIEKWAERRTQLQIDLGDTSLPDVHAVVEKRFVGLANPATGELMMRVDGSAPVTLPSSPQLMSWSLKS
jgi:hypothetical protein